MADSLNELLRRPTDEELIPNINARFPVETRVVGTPVWGPLNPPEVAAPEEQPGLVSAAWQRGLYSTGEEFLNTGGLLAQMAGMDETAQGLYAKAKEYEDAAAQLPITMPNIEDVKSPSDLGKYAVERLVENLPMLASILIPGGVVGKLGTKGAGYAAAFLADAGIQLGESVGIAKDAGENPVDFRVVGSGLGKAALDFVPFGVVAGRLGIGPFVDSVVSKFFIDRGYLTRVAGTAATLVATEVPTEVAQEGINIALKRSLENYQGSLTDDEKSQLINAAVGAASFLLLAPFMPGPRRTNRGNIPTSENEPKQPTETPAVTTEKVTPELKPIQTSTPVNEYELWKTMQAQRDAFTAAYERGYEPSVLMTQNAAFESLNAMFTPTRWQGNVMDEGVVQIQSTPQGVVLTNTIGQIEGIFPSEAEAKQFAEQSLAPKADTVVLEAAPEGGVVSREVGKSDGLDAAAKGIELTGGPKSLTDKTILTLNRGRREANAQLPRQRLKPTGGYTVDDRGIRISEARAEGAFRAMERGLVRPEPAPSKELAQFEPLMREYESLLNDERSYRGTDQQLKGTVRNQLKNIELRAQRLAEMLKVANPLRSMIEVKIEEMTSDWGVNRAAEEASAAPADFDYGNLSESEIAEYAALIQKDDAIGLDPDGYARLEVLRTKAIYGEESNTRPVTEEEVDKLAEAELAVTGEQEFDEDTLTRKDDEKGKGFTVDEAASILADYVRAFKRGPQVMLVRSDDKDVLAKYPAVAREAAVKGVKGFFRPQEGTKVWLFVDRHGSPADLVRSYLHEALGHFGLRAMLTPAEMESLLRAVARNPKVARRVAELNLHRRFGVDPRTNPDKVAAYAKNLSFLDVEEFVAYLAENYEGLSRSADHVHKSLIDRVVSWIKRALVKLGNKKIVLSEKDIIAELKSIRGYLSSGVTGRYRGDIFASVLQGNLNIADVLPFKGDPDKSLKDSQGNYSYKKVYARYKALEDISVKLYSFGGFGDPALEARRDYTRMERERLRKIFETTSRPPGWDVIGNAIYTPEDQAQMALNKADKEYEGFAQGKMHRGETTIKVRQDPFTKGWSVRRVSETRDESVGYFQSEKDANEFAAIYKEQLEKVIPQHELEWRRIHKKHLEDHPLYRLTGDPEVTQVVVENVSSIGDVWGARSGAMFLSPMQMAEKYLPGVAHKYMEMVQLWWARKRELTDEPTQRATMWSAMGKDLADRVANAIFDISVESDRKQRKLTAEEKQRIYKERGLEGTTFVPRKAALRTQTKVEPVLVEDFIGQIFGDFKSVLDKLEDGLIRADMYRFTQDEAKTEALYQLWKTNQQEFFRQAIEVKGPGRLTLGASINEVVTDINAMRNRDYFPRNRFGKYALTLRAKRNVTIDGVDYKEGQIIEFSTYETHAERSKAIESVNEVYKSTDVKAQVSVLKDEEFSLVGMPPQLYDAVRGAIPDMSPEQLSALKNLYYKRSPGKAFLRHLTKRKNTKGWSTDALRVYASYMMNSANHIARVEYSTRMQTALNQIDAHARSLPNADVANIAVEYFNKHFNYLMNPKNDLAALRSIGFLWYLGFNVKSALVNLTQVPMVAHPFLAAQYGDAKALGAITRAMKIVFDARAGKGFREKALADEIARGIKQGFLDESAATELAAFGEADVLKRFLPATSGGKLLSDTAFYGSFLFRIAEKFNREVTFTAAWLLARENGASVVGSEHNLSEAGLKARDAVQTAMFEYAKWNRPTFMRGKKSVFFLFWQYMQGLSYLAFGGRGAKTATRIWLMLLLAAGLQGLPFAEVVFDLFDIAGTKIKETLGMSDPKVQLRNDIRELARQFTDNPDIVMHGLASQYGLGFAHLLGVPNFDVSGSISAGRPVPGVDTLAREYRNPEEKFGKLMVDIFGPVMGVGYNFWKAASTDNPDSWKTWERAMPSVLQQASKALRRDAREAETLKGGVPLVEFNPTNLDHRLENIGQALGFTPTRVARAYELNAVQQDMKLYWTTRRAYVIENYAFAVFSQDQDAISDAREALDRFNKQAPAPQLRITGDTISRSMRERTRQRALRVQGIPKERAFAPLYAEMAENYPQGGQ